MNTIKKLWDRISGKTKRDRQNRQAALAGKTTSGYLRQGERDRMFTALKKKRKLPR